MLKSSGILLAAGILTASAVLAQEPSPTDTLGPRLTLRGFSDVNFAVREEDGPNTFALGQFDTFMSSALSDDVSVLAEVVFEFGEDNAAVLDVERVQLRWAPADAFTATAGRMHTPLGYWNQTFHHGSWLQTTAERPLMYRFEDDGGILPVHMVGVELSGAFNPSPATFKYSASLVNGRGHIPDEIANVQDASDHKAVNLWLGIAPGGSGLEAGVSAYLDTIPGTAGRDEIQERIFGAFFTFSRGGLQLLGELSRVRHRYAGEDFDTWGGYAQAGLKRGRWTPYYRFDRVEVAPGDPFLEFLDLTLHTVGLRYEALSWVAVKGEYHNERPAGAENVHSARVQAAFTF
jgi:hypothetical protein